MSGGWSKCDYREADVCFSFNNTFFQEANQGKKMICRDGDMINEADLPEVCLIPLPSFHDLLVGLRALYKCISWQKINHQIHYFCKCIIGQRSHMLHKHYPLYWFPRWCFVAHGHFCLLCLDSEIQSWRRPGDLAKPCWLGRWSTFQYEVMNYLCVYDQNAVGGFKLALYSHVAYETRHDRRQWTLHDTGTICNPESGIARHVGGVLGISSTSTL